MDDEKQKLKEEEAAAFRRDENEEDPPLSPHERTPSPIDLLLRPAITNEPPALPARPRSRGDDSNIIESGNFATLPSGSGGALRPLSTSYGGPETVYDQLPCTLPRSQKPNFDEFEDKKAPSPEENKMAELKSVETMDEGSEKRKTIEKVVKATDPYASPPNSHMTLTIISMVLCSLIINVFAFICLVPAFLSSRKAKDIYREDYEEATRQGKRSLILNLIAVIVTFAVLLVALVIVLIIFGVTGVF